MMYSEIVFCDDVFGDDFGDDDDVYSFPLICLRKASSSTHLSGSVIYKNFTANAKRVPASTLSFTAIISLKG